METSLSGRTIQEINEECFNRLQPSPFDRAIRALETDAGQSLQGIRTELVQKLQRLQGKASNLQNFNALPFLLDIQNLQTKIDTWKAQGALTTDQLDVLNSVSHTLKSYENQLTCMPTYRRRAPEQSEFKKDIEKDLGKILRASGALLFGVMGAITGYMAKKNHGSMTAPAAYLAAAAVLGYGPGKIFESSGDKTMRNISFLNQEPYAQLMQKYGMFGPEWAEVIHTMQTSQRQSGSAVQKFIAKREKEAVTDEDRKEVVDAIAPNESMHAALMNLISNNDDFTTFVTMTRKATGTDAQKFVESYVKVGGGNVKKWNVG
jgi:hypothetical protein